MSDKTHGEHNEVRLTRQEPTLERTSFFAAQGQKAKSGPGANAGGLTSVREHTNGQVT